MCSKSRLFIKYYLQTSQTDVIYPITGVEPSVFFVISGHFSQKLSFITGFFVPIFMSSVPQIKYDNQIWQTTFSSFLKNIIFDWLWGEYDHIVLLKVFLTSKSKYHEDPEQNLQHSSFDLINFGR